MGKVTFTLVYKIKLPFYIIKTLINNKKLQKLKKKFFFSFFYFSFPFLLLLFLFISFSSSFLFFLFHVHFLLQLIFFDKIPNQTQKKFQSQSEPLSTINNCPKLIFFRTIVQNSEPLSTTIGNSKPN